MTVVLLARYASLSACLILQTPLCVRMAAQTSPAAELRFREARAAQSAGDYARAALKYQAAAKLDPTLAPAYLNLGLVEYVRQHYDESIVALEKAQSLAPDMRGASLYLGLSYEKINRPKQALPLLKKAVAAEPGNKEALIGLANALWETEDIPGSLRALRQALALFPSDTDLLFLLGEAYRKASSGQAEYVVDKSPESALAHLVLAEQYASSLQWSKAERHYRLALQKEANRPGVRPALALVLVARSLPDEAGTVLKEELAHDPASAWAQRVMGELYLVKGKTPEALAEFDLASKAAGLIDPDLAEIVAAMAVDPAARAEYASAKVALEALPDQTLPSIRLASAVVSERLGEAAQPAESSTACERDQSMNAAAEYACGQFQAAEGTLERVLQESPDSFEARRLLGKTYRERSDIALQRLLEIDGHSARAHELLGQIHETQGQSEQALREFSEAARLDPSLPGVHFNMGHVLWTLGRPDQALEALRQELRLNVYHAEANAEIGTILVAGRQPAKGIPYLKTALRLKPDLIDAHRQLGKAYHESGLDRQAATELQAAAAQDRDGSTHYLLAVVFRELGREDDAKQAFSICQKLKAERLSAVNDKLSER